MSELAPSLGSGVGERDRGESWVLVDDLVTSGFKSAFISEIDKRQSLEAQQQIVFALFTT